MDHVANGDRVRLQAYGQEQIVRRVVEARRDVVLVCTEEEYRAARSEERSPLAVGFPVGYVIERVETAPADA
jgi:hypothetical protein